MAKLVVGDNEAEISREGRYQSYEAHAALSGLGAMAGPATLALCWTQAFSLLFYTLIVSFLFSSRIGTRIYNTSSSSSEVP